MNLPAQLHPVLDLFHPAVATWFRQRFATVTEAQAGAWPVIHAGQSMLLAAPTGSGKTLSAFLAVLDELFRQGLEHAGALPAQTQVVYVSPLKALSNDIRLNLDAPLTGISHQFAQLGLEAPRITTAVRTGDTPQKDRAAMRKLAPHILVTTPESLYVLMGSASGRQGLASVHTVIVDEIHALAGNKRGCHLALTLERLQALAGRPLRRIGLSATQRPVERVAQFLVGHERPCAIVDIGHVRKRDLALEVPPVPLGAVMATDVWSLVHDRLAVLAREHRTTLVFVNTRRLAERLTRHLGERLGNDAVAAHHGSLAKEHRLAAEQRLKAGELQVLVATASLELGIDIGDVDLVCQIASPGSIAAFLQRVGRSGHQVEGIPKGRLFPTSRDDLIECVALLDCVRQGELDALHIPHAPLDVLAQQIVAEVSNQPWSEHALFDLLRQATPYAELDEKHYQALLRMLAEGYNGRQGVRGAYLHRDAVNGTLRGRRGSQLTALTSGGTIPETADYTVLLEPQALNIGSVNEDFAVESIAGDIFQLGNASYRILRVEPGRVRVEDAHGLPPTIPFWLGEAPGRSDELSAAVARLQQRIDQQLQAGDAKQVLAWLQATYELDEACASQLLDYLGRTWQVLGALPSQQTLVMERFFDESGGTQLIIHSPFGSRINRAWGLALRKRFCRTFNFELQAAASEDAIVLSLSTSHSFDLDEVWRYLNSRSAEAILVQALLDAPLFGVRWRWNAAVAMALPRYVGGRKVAPQIQRMKSEDLVASVFPDQLACLENIVGERQIPDHPLVEQTLDDCLHEAMDSEGWLALLRRMERGEVDLLSRDLPAPSPLASAILNARPYTFLDDAPLEERRTQAVLNRRWSDVHSADDLGALDADAIAAVQAEAWPQARNPDEMHEALMSLGAMAEHEVDTNGAWRALLQQLAKAGRACQLDTGEHRLWLARERQAALLVLYPDARLVPDMPLLPGYDAPVDSDTALTELLRCRLDGFGPMTLEQIAIPLALKAGDCEQALARLEGQGLVMRGHFSPGQTRLQWCERHLLARIHRYTVKRLRQEIEPVSLQDYLRFLFDWQHVSGETRLRGPQAVPEVLAQLQGFPAAAGAWESDLLPARIKDYSPHWLDEACRSGQWSWSRLAATLSASTLASTPLVLLPREHLGLWRSLTPAPDLEQLGARAQRVLQALQEQGALFFDELAHEARLLPSELESALQELVGSGLASADGFSGLRSLISPAARRRPRTSRRGHPALSSSMAHAGRWALLRRSAATVDSDQRLEHVARSLLRRYGVVCWRLLGRESDVLPAWRALLRCYQRLEARGEIRGGRFIAGLAGEQFALPEAVGLLRQVRNRALGGELVVVSGCDPLNLAGTLLPGTKVPAVAGNRLLYRDGVPVASRVAGRYLFAVEASASEQDHWRQLLLRDAAT